MRGRISPADRLEPGLFYVRFMDDILVLAPTRWKLRRAVATINRGLGALGLARTRTRPSSVASRGASTSWATTSPASG